MLLQGVQEYVFCVRYPNQIRSITVSVPVYLQILRMHDEVTKKNGKVDVN
jgi:hypothetical protein